MIEKLDGMTKDLVKENVEKLKELFPSIVKEDKIDFEELELLLGEDINRSKEQYSFVWNGKTEATKLAQKRSTGTLRPCIEESKNWDTTKNIYIEGDNLEVLKLLQTSYNGRIKMIYIDPPYNTGHDFVYKDNFEDNLANYKEITGQAQKSNADTDGRYHTNWLNMMYPRLKLARTLLSKEGVIFISIDDNEQANLKKICDDVFGENNFIMNIAWRRTDNQPNIGKVAKVKEYILVYSKNQDSLCFGKMPLTDKAKNEYRYFDEKGAFRRAILLDKTRGRHYYDIKTKSGRILKGPWMIKEEEFYNLDKNNAIYWTSSGDEQPYGKIYLSESNGQISNDFWGIEFGTNQRASIELEKLFNERIFDFSKPTTLIKTLIQLGGESDESTILDFFSGSATTAHAVMQLNAEDGGNRKFICVQLPEQTEEDSEAYKAGYKNICEIGKERIRRAGNKLLDDKIKELEEELKKYQQLLTEKTKTEFLLQQDEIELSQNDNDIKNAMKNGQSPLNQLINKTNNKLEAYWDRKNKLSEQTNELEESEIKLKNLQNQLENLKNDKDLDIGFKVFKLDTSNLKKWNNAPTKDANEVAKRIQLSLDYLESGRTELDLVYEIMLKYGLDLTLPITKSSNEKAYIVNGEEYKLLICSEMNLTLDDIESFANESVGTYLFADRCFADDNLLINTQEILKSRNKEMRLF